MFRSYDETQTLVKWIENKITILQEIIMKYCRERNTNINQVLKELSERIEPDNLILHPIWTHMLKNNITYRLVPKWLNKKPIKSYWIQDLAAYQQPAYYWITKTMTEQKQ